MPEQKPFQIAIQNKVSDSGVLELQFLDVISDSFSFDTWTVTSVVQEVINKVNNANPSTIKITIDSEGGDAQRGLSIYGFLSTHKAEKEVHIIGLCGSIATVIACAASPGKCFMAKNAFYIAHEAWGGGIGRAQDLRSQANVIDMYTNQICDIYAKRSGKTAAYFRDIIAKGDYWATFEMAKEMGLVDALIEGDNSFSIAARVQNLNPAYVNLPPDFSPKAQKENTDSLFTKFKNEMENIGQSILAGVKAAMGMKVEETPKAEVKPEEKPKEQEMSGTDKALLIVAQALDEIKAKLEKDPDEEEKPKEETPAEETANQELEEAKAAAVEAQAKLDALKARVAGKMGASASNGEKPKNQVVFEVDVIQ